MIVHLAVKATILSSLLFVNAHANLVAVDVKEEDETASVPDTSQSLKEAKMDGSTIADGNYVEDAFWSEEDLKDLEWNEGVDEDGNVVIYIDPVSYKAKYCNIEEEINPREVIDLSALEGGKNGSLRHRELEGGKNGSLRHRELGPVETAKATLDAVETGLNIGMKVHELSKNSQKDDATFYVKTGDTRWADGESLGIAYHLLSGKRYNDGIPLGVGRGGTRPSTKDLENEFLQYVELYLHNSGDICINHLYLKVGPEPSGTGKQELISIPVWLIENITGASYSKYTPTGEDSGYCVWFGHNKRNLANFKFRWEKALRCYQNFGMEAKFADKYWKCFKGAMVRHDIYYDSGIERKHWTENTALPTNIAFPLSAPVSPTPKWINLKQSGLCAGIDRSDNGGGISLQDCRGNKAQQWNYDSLGRLVNRFSGKCIEFGNKDILYARAFHWTCHTGKHQQWDQLSNGKYRNKAFRTKFLGVQYCGQRSDKRRIEARLYDRNGGNCDCAQTWNKDKCS